MKALPTVQDAEAIAPGLWAAYELMRGGVSQLADLELLTGLSFAGYQLPALFVRLDDFFMLPIERPIYVRLTRLIRCRNCGRVKQAVPCCDCGRTRSDYCVPHTRQEMATDGHFVAEFSEYDLSRRN